MLVPSTARAIARANWLLGLAALASGCAANQPFERGAALDVPALASELEALEGRDDEDALYDLAYFPLAHLDLQAFVENDEPEEFPDGHSFFSIRSWLPLLLIDDLGFERFDAEHTAYEKQEFTWVLWGLWGRARETIQTRHGLRTERHYRLLWILHSGPHVEYEEAAARASR